jgi:UDP:flavonoid glycosyltransferase YjiC (YdhE family)
VTTVVPLIVAGNTEDKPEVAARVEWFGVGVNLRTGTPIAGTLRRAVREILGNDAYRAAPRNLQRAFARRDGVAEVAKLIEEVIAERRRTSHRRNSHSGSFKA